MKYVTIPVMLVITACLSIALADGHFSDDSRVILDGRAESDGMIGLQLGFAPAEDGSAPDAVDIEIMVPNDAKPKDIQTTIENNMLAILGEDRFRVRTSGSKKVSVKANKGTPDFAIKLTNNSVEGVSIEIED
ncbi:MAG: hypothetical protein ACR2QV_12680 [Gammaproteobacteria bacterium]